MTPNKDINTNSRICKTEILLKNYTKYLTAIKYISNNTIKTKKIVRRINNALDLIQDDPYYGIIEMIYFENKTREEVAEFYDVQPKTITRNKKRLVNEIKTILFSDESIAEIL